MTAGPERIGANGSVGPVAKVHGCLPRFDSWASHGGNMAFRLEEVGAGKNVSPGVRIWENGMVWGYLSEEKLTELMKLLKKRNRKPKGFKEASRGVVGYRVRIKYGNGQDYVVLDTDDPHLWEFTNIKPEPVSIERAKAMVALVKNYHDERQPIFSMKDIKIVRVVK